jgi:hypothetical protein
MKRYRYTDVPSLLQGDVPDGDEVCYFMQMPMHCDFHHIMNGAYRKKSEKYGCWVWLCRSQHRWLHDTREGKQAERALKMECQIAFEHKYGHDLWMKEFGHNYVHD